MFKLITPEDQTFSHTKAPLITACDAVGALHLYYLTDDCSRHRNVSVTEHHTELVHYVFILRTFHLSALVFTVK